MTVGGNGPSALVSGRRHGVVKAETLGRAQARLEEEPFIHDLQLTAKYKCGADVAKY